MSSVFEATIERYRTKIGFVAERGERLEVFLLVGSSMVVSSVASWEPGNWIS